MLSGRTVVVCTEGDEADRSLVRSLFAHTSARVVEMTTEDHDRRMAAVLGLAHLGGLTMANALRLSGIDDRELTEVAGPTLSKQLRTAREICGENPDLYFEIQRLGGGPEHGAVWLREALEQWLAAIVDGDRRRFAELMRACWEFLHGATGRGDAAGGRGTGDGSAAGPR